MKHIDLLRQYTEVQANDDGLWFDATHASEAYLQQELRRLVWMIEEADIEQLKEEIRLQKIRFKLQKELMGENTAT